MIKMLALGYYCPDLEFYEMPDGKVLLVDLEYTIKVKIQSEDVDLNDWLEI